MSDSGEPEVVEPFSISVKLPHDVDKHDAQAYLTGLADKINASDSVEILEEDDSTSDGSSRWADATLTVYPNIMCGSKKPGEEGDDDGDDGDDSPG